LYKYEIQGLEMAQEIINIGTFPSDHTGDPLRTAFGKINDNFTEIYNGNVSINANIGVTTVAGRSGNVTLTVNDIYGAASITAATQFVMADYTHWTSNVYTVSDALNQLAARLFAANI
jgi:hypothetical protein